jgi:EAL domain-containing protein (putative c-di-GMP-specific phosphodiesterase class I)/ActR/RegA family two-component response regulator
VSTVRPTERDGSLAEIRVAVADDEETVVDVLRTLIGSDPTLRFVGAANDAEAAIDVALRERPDVILVDVRMPGGGGVRAVREITKRCPPTKIVALSAHEDANTVIGMISAGAHAYVRKAESTEKILRTIHRTVDRPADRPPSLPAKPRLALIAPPLPRPDERAPRVARAILDGQITAEFDPIVDLGTGRTVGFDVRSRVATLPLRSYDSWRADAEAADLQLDFELAAFRAATHALREIPSDLFIEFEVSPNTARSARFRRAVGRSIANQIVLGFSSLVVGDDLASAKADLGETLATLRERGVRVSARDVGAGLPSLRQLLSLAPEFARLDETLTRSVSDSFSNHAIVASATACAAEVGARVIASEVASGDQLEELRALGVEMIQGPIVREPLTVAELKTETGSPETDEGHPTGDQGQVSGPRYRWEERSRVSPSSTSPPEVAT